MISIKNTAAAKHALPRVILFSEKETDLEFAFQPNPFEKSELHVLHSLKNMQEIITQSRTDFVIGSVFSTDCQALRLPGILKNIQESNEFTFPPHLLWVHCKSSENNTNNDISLSALEFHAQLARAAGVHTAIAQDNSQSISNAVASLLSEYPMRHPGIIAPAFDASVEEDLIGALASGEGLRVVFQPQYNPRTQDIVGAHATVRWRHAKHGDISPLVFMPLVHRLELDLLLFSFVEAHAIAMLRRLQRGAKWVPISLNATAKTLCTPQLAEHLAQRMRLRGLPTNLLSIELTPAVSPLNSTCLTAALLSLQAKGFKASLQNSECITEQELAPLHPVEDNDFFEKMRFNPLIEKLKALPDSEAQKTSGGQKNIQASGVDRSI
ncbi:EAL domain-containing protein [Variovorax sp. H27-G14]|uniref:EAL domain-containing protein n=1 Tax=Variovorax sp. H27-G14 TaxID=3111914 RepID=UPI0038FC02CD